MCGLQAKQAKVICAMVVQVELDKVKFFARPRLGLDCVGGASSLRLSDALAQVNALC